MVLPKIVSFKSQCKWVAFGMVTIALSACVTQSPSFSEGIDFREQRFNQISAVKEYRQCRDQALELDRNARQNQDRAKYLASARLIEKCEASLSGDVSDIATSERMKTYALSVQNYFKGGDVEQARVNFDKFKSTFSGQDLFYNDGSSFIDTMDVLLGIEGAGAIGRYSASNVSQDLKSELRRVRYWEHN